MAGAACILAFALQVPPANGQTNPVTVTAAVTATSSFTDGCPSLPAANSNFLTTGSLVWFDFYYTGGNVNDVFSVQWFEPNGTLYTTYSFTQTDNGGNHCYNYAISIAGSPPATLPGQWTVKLVRNNSTAVSAVPFTISTPGTSNTISYSNNVMTKQAPPASGCVQPPAATAFSTNDVAAYLYFEAVITTADNVSSNFLAPDGSVVASISYTSAAGNFCFPAAALSLTNLPQTQFGTWQARVYDNGVLVFSIPFTVSPATGSGTITYSNQVMTKQAPPSSGCVRPPPSDSFLTTDGTAYLYFEATVTTSDNLSTNFLAPDGSTVPGVSYAPGSGNYCYALSSLALTNLPPSQTGAWQARVYDNGTLLFSVPFTVTASGSGSAPNITTISLPGGVVGQPYGPVTVIATGGSGHYTWSVTGAPPGVTITPAGVLSSSGAALGQAAAGVFRVIVTATDSASGLPGSRTYSVTVLPGVLSSMTVSATSVSITVLSACQNSGTSCIYFVQQITPPQIQVTSNGSPIDFSFTGLVFDSSGNRLQNWLLLNSPSLGTLSVAVNVGLLGLERGDAFISISAPGVSNSPQVIPVTYSVNCTGSCGLGPPRQNVAPTNDMQPSLTVYSISFPIPGSGDSAFQKSVGIINSTSAAASGTTISVSPPASWLITPTTGPANGPVSIGAQPAGLAPGKYSTTVSFTLYGCGINPCPSGAGLLNVDLVVQLSLSLLSPGFVNAGTGSFPLTVIGTGLIQGSVINWNGTPLQTTYSNGQLSAMVPGNLIASPGSASISVVNPDGPPSNTLPFTIGPAVSVSPAITSLNPPSVPAGSPSTPVTITGTGFASGAVATFNGVAVSTIFGNSTTLTATIPAADLVSAGTGQITVQNPNGLTSPGFPFIVSSGSTSGLQFMTLTPCRVFDSRLPPTSPFPANSTFGSPYIAKGSVRNIPIPQGVCGVPPNAAAYSLNFSVQPRTTTPGYLTVWPTDKPQPNTSTVSFYSPADVLASASLLGAGTNGAISVTATQDADLFIDINGYFVPPGPGTLQFYPLVPCRVLDTRPIGTAGGSFPVGSPIGPPSLNGKSARTFPIPYNTACPVPANAAAYSFNVAVAPPQGVPVYFVAAYPTGGGAPVSTLNSFNGSTLANAAIVPAGPGGMVDFIAATNPGNPVPTDIFVDINGYFAPPSPGGLNFYPVNPCRIVDTRTPGNVFGATAFTTFGVQNVAVPNGPCGIPSPPAVQAYALGLTVYPIGGGLYYLTAWPTGTSRPSASTINDSTLNDNFQGITLSNAALVPAGAGGAISLFATNPTNATVDVSGYFGP